MNTQDPTYDENCDPNNPRKIKYEDVLAASRRIAGGVVRTACSKSHLCEKFGLELYLKLESRQYTGSFKERGARNTLMLLTDEQKKYGVASATTGNHGGAMSYHATQLGIPVAIFMPTTAPMKKVANVERNGIKVIKHGSCMRDAEIHAKAMCREKRMLYVNGYDHVNILEGQGTIGIEIIEQCPQVEAVLVPVGGGGLIAGVAVAIKHLKPECEVYGIVTDKTCSMAEAFRKNERVTIEVGPTLADGLGVNTVGVNSFATIRNGIVDKMIVVKEDWVARAIMTIVEQERIIIEGAAATGIAALMAGLLPNLKGKKVVCVITGGNIDSTILTRALERGMAAEGRLVKFKVTVFDRPGGLADVCALLAGLGVTIRDCIPERAWVKSDVYSVELKIIAETRGWDHTKELVEQIKKHYKEYYFQEMGERPDKMATTRRGPCLAPNPVCMQK